MFPRHPVRCSKISVFQMRKDGYHLLPGWEHNNFKSGYLTYPPTRCNCFKNTSFPYGEIALARFSWTPRKLGYTWTCIYKTSVKYINLWNKQYSIHYKRQRKCDITYALFLTFSAKHKYFSRLFNSLTLWADNSCTSLIEDGLLQ